MLWACEQSCEFPLEFSLTSPCSVSKKLLLTESSHLLRPLWMEGMEALPFLIKYFLYFLFTFADSADVSSPRLMNASNNTCKTTGISVPWSKCSRASLDIISSSSGPAHRSFLCTSYPPLEHVHELICSVCPTQTRLVWGRTCSFQI